MLDVLQFDDIVRDEAGKYAKSYAPTVLFDDIVQEMFLELLRPVNEKHIVSAEEPGAMVRTMVRSRATTFCRRERALAAGCPEPDDQFYYTPEVVKETLEMAFSFRYDGVAPQASGVLSDGRTLKNESGNAPAMVADVLTAFDALPAVQQRFVLLVLRDTPAPCEACRSPRTKPADFCWHSIAQVATGGQVLPASVRRRFYDTLGRMVERLQFDPQFEGIRRFLAEGPGTRHAVSNATALHVTEALS